MSPKIVLFLAVLHVAVSLPLPEDDLPRPARRCLIVYDPATGTFQALVPTISLQNVFRPMNPNQGNLPNPANPGNLPNPANPGNLPNPANPGNVPNPADPQNVGRSTGPNLLLFL